MFTNAPNDIKERHVIRAAVLSKANNTLAHKQG